MRTEVLRGLVGLVCMSVLLVGCSSGTTETSKTAGKYIIRGEYIRVDPDAESVRLTNENSDSAEFDLSNALVVVGYETWNEDGDSELVVLASASFSDGKVYFEGEVNEPTEAEIFVQVSEEKRLSTRTVLVPDGEEISFALLDRQTTYPADELILIGTSRSARDPSSAFTVRGDLSAIEMNDLTLAIASVESSRFDEKGARLDVRLGTVLLRNKTFEIDAEIDEISAVSISVEVGLGWGFRSSTLAVIEPNAEITVVSHEAPQTLIASSNGMSHMNLIESWQQSDEFQSKMTEYIAAWKKEHSNDSDSDATEDDTDAGERALKDFLSSESQNDSAKGDAVETDGVTGEARDSVVAQSETSGHTVASSPLAAAGCEHVPSVATNLSFEDEIMALLSDYPSPPSVLLRQELETIQSNALNGIAKHNADPLLRLLAMELGAFSGSDHDDSRTALSIYDALEKLLDEDLAARRVSHPRSALALRLETETNDDSLIPGQRAPEFELPALDGTSHALSDILKKNEVVLVDFWASWCVPCIASFPDLKKLYTTYRESGFEIIGVSLDDTFEEWEQASLEQELPWLDVADLGGFAAATPVAYGVGFIPKGYLIDTKGCILQKNLLVDELTDELLARLGDRDELKRTNSGIP